MDPETPTAVGIDLGTTYSCVAVYKNGRVHIIENNYSRRMTPSCVAFMDDGIVLIGDAAKENLLHDPANTFFSIKRIIGRLFKDKSVQNDIKTLPFPVVADKNDKPMLELVTVGPGLQNRKSQQYAPEDISAEILGKMKRIAENYLGHKVKDAVVTIPASFNDSQRQATYEAAKKAGLNVLRLLNEPTAAAVAYGLENFSSVCEKNILVFDFGGGTLDVSILSVAREHVCKVKATAGNSHLGGEDIDSLLVKHFAEQFHRENGFDLKSDKKAVQRLTAACERAKCSLSDEEYYRINIEGLCEGRNLVGKLSRSQFETVCGELFRQALLLVQEAIASAGIAKEDVDEIVLAGGSSRIPAIQRMLRGFFDDKKLRKDIAPEEAVAYGAAIMAAKLSGAKIVDPSVSSMKLVDITSHALGVRLRDKTVSKVIPRGISIPCKMSKEFLTSEDGQKSVGFRVYEGEHKIAEENNYLGEFSLNDVPVKPQGEVKFDVTLEIDDNGILSASGVERSTGKANQITFTRRIGCSNP